MWERRDGANSLTPPTEGWGGVSVSLPLEFGGLRDYFDQWNTVEVSPCQFPNLSKLVASTSQLLGHSLLGALCCHVRSLTAPKATMVSGTPS